MEEMKKISLSQGTEVEIRGLTVKVYAPTFEKFVALQEQLAKFEKVTDVREQMEAAVEILYSLLNPYNPTLSKEDIKAKFTMEAFTHIITLAFGVRLEK